MGTLLVLTGGLPEVLGRGRLRDAARAGTARSATSRAEAGNDRMDR